MNDMTNEAEEFVKLTVRDVCDFLEEIESALVVCHVSPDGDAVGSALALAGIIRAMGKEAKCAAPSPVPHFLSFIVKDEDFSYHYGDEDDYDAVITVDVASPSQLGTSSHLCDIAEIMIDHHASGEVFTDNLVEPDASATGEIIAEIYDMLAEDGTIEKDPMISAYMYTAISADTGSFKYNNTTPRTLRCAASLMEDMAYTDEITADEIARLLHDTMTEKDMSVMSLIMSTMKKYEDGALVGTVLTSSRIKAAGLTEADLGGAIDIPRKMEGALAAFVLRQSPSDPTSYKLSTRANTDIDVAAVCALFGGGGHVRAAGATVKASTPGKALEMTVDAMSAAVRNYISSKEGEKR